MPQRVTPWEVSGNVDYDRVVKQFGVAKIDDKLFKRIGVYASKKNMPFHHLLRRKIFFAHRDLNWALDQYDKKNPFFLYTGRAPSGPVHLGHLVPWMFCKYLQDLFGVELWFQFPDEEKFLFKESMTLEETAKWTEENMLDVIALGFDPKKTHFLVDTKHAGIMFPQAIRVAKKITYSTAKAVFGFSNDQNIGAIFYTAMQAVPAFLPSVLAGKPRPCLIPHAIDQDPHFRVSRDVITKLGYPKPASIQCSFLPGLGQVGGKMSTSAHDPDTQVIFTTDSAAKIKKKINKYAFSGGQATVEEHRKKGGNPDVDVSFQYLRYFEEDDAKLAKIHDEYRSGKLLTGDLKKILIEKLTSFLERHQKERERAKTRINQFIFKSQA